MYYKVKGFLIEKIQLYLDNKNSNIKILGNLNNNTTYQHEIELHLELPRDRKHGHFATTIAFSLAKILKNNPKLIADEISSFLLDCAKDFTIFDFVQNINGYINLHISSSFICSEISYALNNTKHNIDKYTAISLPNLNQHRILLEYVSANPTGPLHIGHARGAIFGNVLQKLGKYLGYDIYGEYYVNDAGSQIETCAISVYLEIAKKYDICVDEKYRNSSLYLGEYISDLVEPLVANFGIQFFQNFSDDSMDTLADFVKNLMLDEIKSNLALLDIYFDNFLCYNTRENLTLRRLFMDIQNNKELAEDKVLILYLLNKIDDGIKNDNLYKIVSSSKDINYFYFQELMADLKATNLVCSFTQDEENFIKITTDGKNALDLTKSLLPGLLKLKADTIFKKENSNIIEESSVVTEFIPQDENNYTVRCKIVEQNETIFELSVHAASREKAKQISDNWNKNANKLYPEILKLISSENISPEN